jgi:hypothetical protein
MATKDDGWNARSVAGRWFPALFVLLLVTAGLFGPGTRSARAMPPEPLDPFEPGGTYNPPSDGFTWWMDRRFGVDGDMDGIVDYVTDPAYVRATTFKVNFNGCPDADESGLSDAGRTLNTYRFRVNGSGTYAHRCRITHTLAHGSYNVTLDVLTPEGDLNSYAQTVTVKDQLIVSIGDSYSSGEGNPDVAQAFTAGFVGAPARWVDRRCHRSAIAGPARAALELEYADPHSSVTFVSVACSGATISTPDADDPSLGTGVLGSYEGIEPAGATDMLPPQLDQVQAIVGVPRAAGTRKIDALIMSVGGNDLQFSKIVTDCVLVSDCSNATAHSEISSRLSQRKSELPGKYDLLGQRINQLLDVKKIYISEYPNPTLADDGSFCDPAKSQHTEPLFVGLSLGEVSWLYQQLFLPLNTMAQQAAQRNGWGYIGGVAAAFGSPGTSGHGYCSFDSFMRRSPESMYLQGPWSPFIWDVPQMLKTKGTLHPNARGHLVYRDRILAALAAANNPGPAFSDSLSYYTTSTTSTTARGWLTGICSGSTCRSDQAVLTVTAQDPSGIRWGSVTVDGQPGCAAGVMCDTSKIDGQHFGWGFFFTADGIHRLEFTAVDGDGNASTYTREIRVDLHDPSATATTNPQGLRGGYSGGPVSVTLDGTDPAGGAGIGAIRYQLDNGAWQVVTPGSAVAVAAAGKHTLQYQAVDLADRMGPVQSLVVYIDQTPPATTARLDPVANAAGWSKSNTTVILTPADGDGAGVLETTYSATGAQPISSTTVTGQAGISITTEGQTTISFFSKDRVGNVEAAKSVTVRLDKTLPVVSLTAPANSAILRDSVVLTANAIDNVKVVRVDFLVNGAVVGRDYTAPFSMTWDTRLTADGAKKLVARAVDQASNVKSVTQQIFVNNYANTIITSGPAAFTPSTAATFTFTAWDPNSRYECALDGAPFTGCTSPASYAVAPNRGHTVQVRSTSPGGVVDTTPAMYEWVMDNIAPGVSAPVPDFPSPATLGTSAVPVELRWSGNDGNGSGIALYQLAESMDGGATYTAVALPPGATAAKTIMLEPGSRAYRFKVRARDRAGNWSPWVAGASFTLLAYHECDSAISYTRNWQTGGFGEPYGGSTMYVNDPAGGSATFQFDGSGVAWIASYSNMSGVAEIWLDGTQVATVDLYAATTATRQVAYSVSGLDPLVSHILEVRALGTSGSTSIRAYVDVDAFLTIR